MKLIVAGSRSLDHVRFVEMMIDYMRLQYDVTEIISGGAFGVDAIAANYARAHGIKFTEYPADWDNLGRRAGIERNILMGEDGDVLLAIWDGKSNGTRHMVSWMHQNLKPVHLITVTWKHETLNVEGPHNEED